MEEEQDQKQIQRTGQDKRLVLPIRKSLETRLQIVSSSHYELPQSQEQRNSQLDHTLELPDLKVKIKQIKLIAFNKQDNADEKVMKIKKFLKCQSGNELSLVLKRIQSISERESQDLQNISLIQVLDKSKDLYMNLEQYKKQIKRQLEIQMQKKMREFKQRLSSSKDVQLQRMKEKEKQFLQIINKNEQIKLANKELTLKLEVIQTQISRQMQLQKNEEYNQLRRRYIECNVMKQTFANKLNIANKRMVEYIEITEREKEQQQRRFKERQKQINSLEEQRDYHANKVQNLVKNYQQSKGKKQIEIRQLRKTNEELNIINNKLGNDLKESKLRIQQCQAITLQQQDRILKQAQRFQVQKKVITQKIVSLESLLSSKDKQNSQLSHLLIQQKSNHLQIVQQQTVKTPQSQKKKVLQNINQITKQHQLQNKKVKNLQEQLNILRQSAKKLQGTIYQLQRQKIQQIQSLKRKIKRNEEQHSNYLARYRQQLGIVNDQLQKALVKNNELQRKQSIDPKKKVYLLINQNYDTDMKIVFIFDLLKKVLQNLDSPQKQNMLNRIGMIFSKNH